MPFDVVSEHAQEDLGADVGFGVDEDRPDSQPLGLDLPNGLRPYSADEVDDRRSSNAGQANDLRM